MKIQTGRVGFPNQGFIEKFPVMGGCGPTKLN